MIVEDSFLASYLNNLYCFLGWFIMKVLCPCHSGKSYLNCCAAIHKGKYPGNALELMRSRYSAYAYHNPEYIMETTHPLSPYIKVNNEEWRNELLEFCKKTQFEDLKILEFIDGDVMAYVTFFAKLNSLGKDISFIEKSLFEKVGNRWYYRNKVN